MRIAATPKYEGRDWIFLVADTAELWTRPLRAEGVDDLYSLLRLADGAPANYATLCERIHEKYPALEGQPELGSPVFVRGQVTQHFNSYLSSSVSVRAPFREPDRTIVSVGGGAVLRRAQNILYLALQHREPIYLAGIVRQSDEKQIGVEPHIVWYEQRQPSGEEIARVAIGGITRAYPIP